jgi:hypothetical protein
MHKVKYLTVEITKDKMSKVVSVVPQWEAQVLVALWGDEAQITGESFEMRELPEVNDEFTRLADKYGPRDEDVPMVAKVYGSFGPGLQALEHEFAVSTMSPESEKGVDAGAQLPGSNETFGPDAVPKVIADIAETAEKVADIPPIDITDLIGEGDGGAQTE